MKYAWKLVAALAVAGAVWIAFLAFGARQDAIRAKRTAEDLARAIIAFKAEFSSYPTAYGNADAYMTTDDADLIQSLISESDDSLSPRRLTLLKLPEDAIERGELTIDDRGKPIALLDPWGSPYHLWIDSNEDGALTNPDPATGCTIRLGAIAVSPGPDAELSTWEDNVTSWH